MRPSRDVWLNVVTVILALAAVTAFVNDRVRPTIAERARLDPGESIGEPLLVRRIGQNDTLTLSGGEPALVIVFQSTCAVCERVAPVWRTNRPIRQHSTAGAGTRIRQRFRGLAERECTDSRRRGRARPVKVSGPIPDPSSADDTVAGTGTA